jgi:hypothetical protein
LNKKFVHKKNITICSFSLDVKSCGNLVRAITKHFDIKPEHLMEWYHVYASPADKHKQNRQMCVGTFRKNFGDLQFTV